MMKTSSVEVLSVYDDFFPMESNQCNTNGRILLTAKEMMQENKTRFLTFYENILVSL